MTLPTGNRASRSAFTLVEILVSVAILSIGIASVFAAYHSCLSALDASSDRLRATLMMKEQITRIEIEGFSRAGSDRFSDEGGVMVGNTSLRRVWQCSGSEVNEVALTVRRGHEGKVYSLATYVRETGSH